jgi:hypothetical protein
MVRPISFPPAEPSVRYGPIAEEVAEVLTDRPAFPSGAGMSTQWPAAGGTYRLTRRIGGSPARRR